LVGRVEGIHRIIIIIAYPIASHAKNFLHSKCEMAKMFPKDFPMNLAENREKLESFFL
jgi:hypothetical protein